MKNNRENEKIKKDEQRKSVESGPSQGIGAGDRTSGGPFPRIFGVFWIFLLYRLYKLC